MLITCTTVVVAEYDVDIFRTANAKSLGEQVWKTAS